MSLRGGVVASRDRCLWPHESTPLASSQRRPADPRRASFRGSCIPRIHRPTSVMQQRTRKFRNIIWIDAEHDHNDDRDSEYDPDAAQADCDFTFAAGFFLQPVFEYVILRHLIHLGAVLALEVKSRYLRRFVQKVYAITRDGAANPDRCARRQVRAGRNHRRFGGTYSRQYRHSLLPQKSPQVRRSARHFRRRSKDMIRPEPVVLGYQGGNSSRFAKRREILRRCLSG